MLSMRFRADHPGHVLAAHGLAAVAARLAGKPAEPVFEGDRCSIVVDGSPIDLHELIGRVAAGRVESVPTGKPKDKAAPLLFSVAGFPEPLRLAWWTDVSLRAFKMWNGRQDIRVSFEKLLTAVRKLPADAEPFEFAVPMTGRLGWDPSAGRSVIDMGFSPDRIGWAVLTPPIVELFAAVGLQAWQCRHVGDWNWEYVVDGVRWRFGMHRRGKYRALGWGEEVFDE